MAKKKKAKKTLKKKITRKPAVKKQAGTDYVKTIIIAVVIFAAAVAAGAGVSLFRSSQLEKSAVISKVSTESITIMDKENNKSYKMKVDPASAKLVNQATPVKPNVTSQPVTNLKDLFKKTNDKTKIPRIDIKEAKYLYDSGKAVFLDARGQGAYDQVHIKGALSMPLGQYDKLLADYKKQFKNKVLVAYCSGVGCRLSDKLANKLFDSGYNKIIIFFGGWQKWDEAGYPENKVQAK